MKFRMLTYISHLLLFTSISHGSSIPLLPSSCVGRPLKSMLSCLNLSTNLKLILDAGSSSSYSSGDVWSDESGNGYHFNRGNDNTTSGSEPAFNGTVGKVSSTEFWSMDGGDYFRYNTSNPSWVENLHKDGAKFTYIVMLQFNGTPTGGVSRVVAGTMGNNPSMVGHQFQITDTGAPRLQVWNSSTQCINVTGSAVVTQSAWHFVAVSIDENAGASGGVFYMDGAIIGSAFNPSYSSPASGAATYPMEIGGAGNAQRLFNNTDRIAVFAAWEGVALTTAQLDQIFAALRSRFGI